MNKYETMSNSTFQHNLFINPDTKYNYNKEINESFNNLETNIYENYNKSSFNYYEIKNIVRNEFAELILPYQKQLNNLDNVIDRKINNVECNIKGIIDSKSFENMNQTAQMINIFLKNSNIGINRNGLQNNNENNYIINKNNNLENKLNMMLKEQYDNKFDDLERQIDSMNSLLTTFQKTFDSNMLDILKNNEIKRTFIEKSEYEKYKNAIDMEINKIKEEQKKIKAMNQQIEKLFKKINELTIENNETKNASLNEMNLLKKNNSNIEKIIIELQNKINFSHIDKLNEINIDDLKNINIYEINEIKGKFEYMNNNIDELYEKIKYNDQHLNNMNNKFNELEQNLDYINKDVEYINKQNLNDQIEELNKKFEEINNKLEEYHVRNKSITNKMENIDKIIHDDNGHENNIDKNNSKNNENDNIFGLTGSRRQRRNLTKSENMNFNKNNNFNLDENTTKILKQIENINIDNINMRLENLSNENKIILSKIETNNDNFMNINEQENKLNLKLDELNKKIKESENRLYLLELKNFGNINENKEETKENQGPFSPVNDNKKDNSKIKENDKNNIDFDLGDAYLEENKNINLNKANNEDSFVDKLMKEKNNNNNKDISYEVAHKEDKSYKDISISSLIKPILEDDKNRKSNINNSKIKEEPNNNKNNDIDNYDDFDDI